MKYMIKTLICLVFFLLIILGFQHFKAFENFTGSSNYIPPPPATSVTTNPTDETVINKPKKTADIKIQGSSVGSSVGSSDKYAYNANDIVNGSGFKYKTTEDKNDMYVNSEKGDTSNFVGSGDTLYAYDRNGNLVQVPYESIKGMVSYYEPGNYQFDMNKNTYSPSKENTHFSSILTGETEYSQVSGTPSQMGGICKNYKNNPDLLEQACNSLDTEVCGATECCVLLGGSKCVSGDKKGPTMRSNYSDVLLKNKDFYYHKGECYGNCVNDAYKTPEVEKPKEEININVPEKINISINVDPAAMQNSNKLINTTTNNVTVNGSGSGSGMPTNYKTPNDVNNLQYGYTYNPNSDTENNFMISYNVKGDWMNIGDTWNKIQHNFFGNTSYKDTGFDIYNPDYTVAGINSAITQLKQTPPNTNNAIDFIATSISIHKNNINNINQSIFNLNVALTNINGGNKMSAEVALASMKKALKFWPNDEIISAWNQLSGSSSNIQAAVNHINNAISSENTDNNTEKSIVNALNSALNSINKITPDVSTGILNLNTALSILQKWKNITLDNGNNTNQAPVNGIVTGTNIGSGGRFTNTK
jgi:hypothetical protein